MRSVKLSVLAVAVLFAAAVIPAIAADITVGQFVQKLAMAKNLNATDAQVAADSLRAAGVRIPDGLRYSKRLTEADVVQVSRAAGLPVNTTNPEAPFDPDQVDRFFVAFAEEIGATPPEAPVRPNTPWFDPFTKGNGNPKGWGKGHRTPSEPE